MILDNATVFHGKRRLTQSEEKGDCHGLRALFIGPFRLGIALVKAMALAYGRAGKSSQTRCMLHPACKGTGSLSAVDRLAAALTPNDYEQLTSFAARRLRSARATCRQGDRLAVVEPADLVHQAVLKALLGQAGFPGGWHLRATDLVNPQTFRRALQSIINSTAIALAKRAEYRTDHVPVGDPATEPGAVEPENRLDTQRLLELRDVRSAVFQELRKKAAGYPERQRLIDRWEAAFLTEYQLSPGSDSRQRCRQLRTQIQKVLRNLGREMININAATGKEILL